MQNPVFVKHPNDYISFNLASIWVEASSVTRLDNLLDFGQHFKAFGNILFAQIYLHSHSIFVKVSKSLIFLVKSFLGNFYKHLAIFYWSHWRQVSIIDNIFSQKRSIHAIQVHARPTTLML